jgi:DNA-binding transcriptional ArsR family regulator
MHFILARILAVYSFNKMVKRQSTSLDRTFAALSDPTRRGILRSLSRGETSVTELAKPFSISLPAVSRHLGVLETAGFLRRHRCGREHRLQLNAAPMREAVRWIETYRIFWEGTLDSLTAYLENPAAAEKPNKNIKS